MTVVMVRPKAEQMYAWQYPGAVTGFDLPAWVAASITAAGADGLTMKRRSGRQLVRPCEWLVKHPDERDLIHCTDAEFKHDYEVTPC